MDAAISGLDRPVLKVDFDLVELFDLLGYSRHLQSRQADSEAVTVEASRETLRDHRDDVRIFDSDRRLISAGAASIILPRHNSIPRLHFLVALRFEPLRAILCHLHRLVAAPFHTDGT